MILKSRREEGLFHGRILKLGGRGGRGRAARIQPRNLAREVTSLTRIPKVSSWNLNQDRANLTEILRGLSQSPFGKCGTEPQLRSRPLHVTSSHHSTLYHLSYWKNGGDEKHVNLWFWQSSDNWGSLSICVRFKLLRQWLLYNRLPLHNIHTDFLNKKLLHVTPEEEAC
jgi:hypothetical protein